MASTGNVDAINTSNARFGQVLSEIWLPEVFWSQNSCGRAQTGRVARQRKQVVRRRNLVTRERVPKVKKLLEAISHSKLVQIGRLRCFLASIGNVDARNTSNARFGQVLSEIWPLEVFWSQNSCGRAQTGRVAQQRKQVVRRCKLVMRRRVLVVRRRVLVVRRRVLVVRRRVLKVRKLWKVISDSRLVKIGHLRCFLASTENVDFKKHLKRPIGPNFE